MIATDHCAACAAGERGRYDLGRRLRLSRCGDVVAADAECGRAGAADPAAGGARHGRRAGPRLRSPGPQGAACIQAWMRISSLSTWRKPQRSRPGPCNSKGKVSAYEGMQVQGMPVMTLVRGRIVARVRRTGRDRRRAMAACCVRTCLRRARAMWRRACTA